METRRHVVLCACFLKARFFRGELLTVGGLHQTRGPLWCWIAFELALQVSWGKKGHQCMCCIIINIQ